MPAINIVDGVHAIQYTGSNSAEIDGLITDFDITSEVGGVLLFTSGGNPYVANTGDWVRYTQGFVLNTHTTASLNFLFERNALYSDLTAIQSSISTLQSAVTTLQTQVAALSANPGLLSAGIFEVPALLLPSTVNVDVPLTVTLVATAGRTIQAKLFASAAVLATLSIGTPTFLSTSLVRVPVTSTGILAVSAARVLVTIT